MTHLHPEVKDFPAAQPLKMCIGGQWTEAASGKTFETLDPGNGKRIASVAAGDATDVDRAVQASPEVGRSVGEACGRNPVPAKLELGGKGAAVLFDDVELVNRSSYGLANSVWSRDLDRANRVAGQLVAGNTWINAHNLFAHGVPYGGCNLSGCGGGVLGPDTLEDYFRKQSVVRPLAG